MGDIPTKYTLRSVCNIHLSKDNFPEEQTGVGTEFAPIFLVEVALSGARCRDCCGVRQDEEVRLTCGHSSWR